MNLKLAAIAACLLPSAAMAGGAGAPLATIPSLDVARYMGTWYEIAKYPNRFQMKCASRAKADYRLQSDGTVQVRNSCLLADGTLDQAVGTARQVGGASSPTFEVRFAPAWLSFIPALWGDYWIIDLDPDYRLAAVGEPRRKYLWVLSRTPKVDPQAYEDLLGRLRTMGFDLSKLQTTVQEEVARQ